MEVWAEAMRTLSMADDDTNLSLVLKVINENNYIPVIVLDSKGQATTFRNVRLHGQNYQDSLQEATLKGRQLLDEGRCIRIQLGNSTGSDYINVCYDDSRILKQLNYFPYVYLAIVVIFFGVVIFALLMSKRAEQNRVWAGLSKETAHQLGTPISSLMAWVEILKEEYPNDELIPEMDKDVQRLQLIADRFSKVGSKPEMKEESLTTVIDHVVDYMDRRTSRRVRMIKDVPDHDIMVCLNVNLFEWVVENLCKNAADAMGGGAGTITLRLEETGKLAVLEVSDTGKGIRKKDLANVFRPGFTTKKRGWGLGLSLAKRIVEDYHKGRIFVKWSEVGVGTTFRIELSK
ncbi:sensor histidine kinase [Prevotella sp. CAG:924]|nr:sensor histidine kinase [Prevotella sp. CAG:924]